MLLRLRNVEEKKVPIEWDASSAWEDPIDVTVYTLPDYPAGADLLVSASTCLISAYSLLVLHRLQCELCVYVLCSHSCPQVHHRHRHRERF